jgi:hypothetical protein
MGFQDFSFPGSSRSVAQGSCATPSEAAGVPQAQSPGGFGSAMAMAPGWAAVGRVCSAGLRIEPAAAGAPACWRGEGGWAEISAGCVALCLQGASRGVKI